MADITRRDIVAICGGAIAGDHAGRIPTGERMTIERYGITEATADIPIISLVTVHDDVVHLCGITADPGSPRDIKEQTRQVLERIDRLLGRAGTSKSNLISATVWLTDMAHFADHNAVWNAWVDPKNPPVRACLQSPQLWRPGLLVEIMATAAK
ncbi:RidA family protein [Bradyrhizobium cenepequi]|uniref:RidA family protein n=1 Tax=Bradyrhizobium cenepequi TaxID=2821403 RepID=UPI001CE33D8C|nr:RidA family protein [Bradyrhizobium cenepequi]